jgi:hypothetical protein
VAAIDAPPQSVPLPALEEQQQRAEAVQVQLVAVAQGSMHEDDVHAQQAIEVHDHDQLEREAHRAGATYQSHQAQVIGLR